MIQTWRAGRPVQINCRFKNGGVTRHEKTKPPIPPRDHGRWILNVVFLFFDNPGFFKLSLLRLPPGVREGDSDVFSRAAERMEKSERHHKEK
jgi:hypothetical protein